MKGSLEYEIWADFLALRKKLLDAKPPDRIELARRYAITITQLELVMSFFNTMIQMQVGMEEKE